jgi:hypothetical protein
LQIALITIIQENEMGGIGSGVRQFKKTTVESCLILDGNRFLCFAKKNNHRSFEWTWQKDENPIAALRCEAISDGQLLLAYDKAKRFINYPVSIKLTGQPNGGYRQWLVCRCGRMVAKLYLVQNGIYFHCRHCLDLTYESCRKRRINMNLLEMAWKNQGAWGCKQRIN